METTLEFDFSPIGSANIFNLATYMRDPDKCTFDTKLGITHYNWNKRFQIFLKTVIAESRPCNYASVISC